MILLSNNFIVKYTYIHNIIKNNIINYLLICRKPSLMDQHFYLEKGTTQAATYKK